MEKERTRSDGASVWPYLLIGMIGAAAGAAGGIFFAPRRGEESRRKLADWLREKREKGEHELRARKLQVEAAIEAGRKAYKSDKENIEA